MNWKLAALTGLVAVAPSIRCDLVIVLAAHYIPAMIGLPRARIVRALLPLLISQGSPGLLWPCLAIESLVGMLLALAYAGALLRLRRPSSPLTGVVGGVGLWLACMVSLPLFLMAHPLVISGRMANPGLFMGRLGLGWIPAAMSLMEHTVYGLLGGIVYRHRPRVAAVHALTG